MGGVGPNYFSFPDELNLYLPLECCGKGGVGPS